MKKILLALVVVFASVSFAVTIDPQGKADRQYTINMMQKIADRVLIPLSQDKLTETMPTKEWESKASLSTTQLQAFGRTISGMAPWLSLPQSDSTEGKLRQDYIKLIRKCLINATNPEAKDYMFGNVKIERIVHAAYIAYPLLVIGDKIYSPLTDQQKENVINALKTHRQFKPFNNNWLLFSSVLECTIWKLTGECEMAPIEKAIESHRQWYRGDGTYGDGGQFHWDYYNSFVIHPLLLETLKVYNEMGKPDGDFLNIEIGRAKQYTTILEHLISPKGTYPVIGRSSTYRMAVFQIIGYMGYRWELPAELNSGATRAALTTVIKNLMETPGTFDADGWLNPGIVGHQENARDSYNTLGALYMCVMGLSHLGMPADSAFWAEPTGKWFSQKVWTGENIEDQTPYHGNRYLRE